MNPQVSFLLNKALESLRSSNLQSAELYLKQATRLDAKNPHVFRLLGVIAGQRQEYLAAIDYLNTSLKALPKNPLALINLGNVYFDLGEYSSALEAFDKSIKLDSTYEEAWYNKGNVLFEMGQYDDALLQHDRAIELKPNYCEALTNKGLALHELKRFNEAIEHYDAALGINPNHHEASWNKSLTLLLQGDFKNGLPLYESRWKSILASAIAGKRIFEKPCWIGVESLQDKKILLYGEQGLGDFIQFSRYVKLVSNLGAKVILEVPSELASIMSNLEGASNIVVRGEVLPSFDYQCPLMSLPYVFKTEINTIPGGEETIKFNDVAKTMHWEKRLGFKDKPRVGLVWSGNPRHKNDGNRSLPLKEILSFLPDGYQFVSLQKEVRDSDRVTLEDNPRILHFAGELVDFSDTAALINCLDLVITVDTSVAHLSAAMDRKTWLLLPCIPDWRWLLDGDTSPWYPAMKLFRQQSKGNWDPVLNKIGGLLELGKW